MLPMCLIHYLIQLGGLGFLKYIHNSVSAIVLLVYSFLRFLSLNRGAHFILAKEWIYHLNSFLIDL